MPKISFEGMAGLLMEIIVIILEQVHVTAAYIIWPLFIFGAYLIGDAIWRGEWKKSMKNGQQLSGRLFAAWHP